LFYIGFLLNRHLQITLYCELTKQVADDSLRQFVLAESQKFFGPALIDQFMRSLVDIGMGTFPTLSEDYLFKT